MLLLISLKSLMQTRFEVFDESIVEVLTEQAGQLVRLPELGSRLTVGETGVVRLGLILSIHDSNIYWLQDVLPPPATSAQILFESPRGNNYNNDVVVAVKHTVYAVAWLAVNQSVRNANFTVYPLLSSDLPGNSSTLLLQRIN